MPGKTFWAIPEGYIPEEGKHAEDPALRSHETACVLNINDAVAHLKIMVYFNHRDPAGPFHLEVAPRRTLHFRFDQLAIPEIIPRETDYASVIEASLPVIVQHTRLDARLGGLALMTSMAYGEA